MTAARGPGRPPKKRHWQRTLTTPPDRRPPAPERDLTTGQIHTREAAIALARMKGPALAAHSGIKVNACEGFKPYYKQRGRWTKRRVREMGELYGPEISVGVGAAIRAAGWGHAFGSWLCAMAAETGDAGVANLAMSILAKASTEDRRAHELAALEARLRKDATPAPDLGSALEAEGTNTTQ